MSKYIVTKAQVEEMYNEVVGSWQTLRYNKFAFVLYTNKVGNVEWAFVKGKLPPTTLFKHDDPYSLFEWVVLKEVGGRKQYNKKELIDGLQSRIHNNYLASRKQMTN